MLRYPIALAIVGSGYSESSNTSGIYALVLSRIARPVAIPLLGGQGQFSRTTASSILKLRAATKWINCPSNVQTALVIAPHRSRAFAAIASNTDWRSVGERLMTLKTSEV